ncbi:MAG: hypothetical protein DRI57_13650 [Deltaproteobacteria bacterium]|nr:MAG: hypothetical protein DRI57_13650 [Deltaproteobacteria bacterium]
MTKLVRNQSRNRKHRPPEKLLSLLAGTPATLQLKNSCKKLIFRINMTNVYVQKKFNFFIFHYTD